MYIYTYIMQAPFRLPEHPARRDPDRRAIETAYIKPPVINVFDTANFAQICAIYEQYTMYISIRKWYNVHG